MGCLELTIQNHSYIHGVSGKNAYSRFSHHVPIDPDGNLLADDHRTYAWDAENRLIKVESAMTKVECAYDYQSRRVAKKTHAKNGENWTLTQTEKYAYDGWNGMAVFDSANVLQKSYLWGEDLSGSLQGAGGVGGLLAETGNTGSDLPAYDGNGNIMTYVNAAGTVQADYIYDPFGRTLAASGDLKDAFAYRFSTKPLDSEVGLYYYGYRYYSPDLGRWLSRDPIGEAGGENVYRFVNNNAWYYYDYLGRDSVSIDPANGLTISGPVSNWLSDAILGDGISKTLNSAYNLARSTAQSVYNSVRNKWLYGGSRQSGKVQ